ncbi:adenosylcobinamide-phosphate synthase CbiB [Pectinatus sottacetonis]|uniref:adenosylcobinamide-phosphate synthase CbiB n=1 Tax=Pectinatus sottacetonis TaxID=1002795 RepID=UPI0018C4CCE8|nr:adenosylcobinamide-phosphate synthase CbiB [Pectinatus sottacetonis]
MITSAIIVICAFIIDTIIGDPNSKYHPVAVMGRLVGILDSLLYRKKANDPVKLVLGLILSIICLSTAYWLTRGIIWGMELLKFNWWIKIFLDAVILSFMISPKSLMQAGLGVINNLIHDDIEAAREKVHYIVGRDVNNMDEAEMVRATIETIAENTTDGIISPLFFFFIGGLPLAVLYRMANTLDSMVGYKNDRYLYFGRASARIDDILNLIPARIAGILIVISAAILHFDYKNAWKIMKRDAKKHPSPNGGFTEASVAGALNIRLGGQNYYFGKPHFRAYMGDPYQKLCARHIVSAIQLMYTATVLFIALVIILLPIVPLWWHSGF